jgi:quercetin dioxygenase-like cupin family protein
MPDGRAVVKTAASRAFFSRGTGLRTSHIFTTADGAAQGLTGTTEFAPGAEVPWHTHNCEETVSILGGEALFEADGEQTELVAGDATWTPVGVVHRFANRGRGPLRILWTYGSVDATRTLVATGATTSIAAESQANPAATLNIQGPAEADLLPSQPGCRVRTPARLRYEPGTRQSPPSNRERGSH